MSLRYESTNDGPTVLETCALELTDDIFKAQKDGRIRIFSGECHAGLYSHERVVDALSKARGKGVKIDVIAGPILSVLVDNYKKYSGILNLSLDGTISLYPREKKGYECHYRIIDESLVRVEDSHQSLEDFSLRNSRLITSSTKIKEYIHHFDKNLSRLKPTHDPEQDLVLLSPKELEVVKLHYHKFYPGREFIDLERQEIEIVVDNMKYLWNRDTSFWVKHYRETKTQMDKALAHI